MFHSKDTVIKGVMKSYTPPHNMLDSTAPKIKRGKEREVPRVKRPTALKKVWCGVIVQYCTTVLFSTVQHSTLVFVCISVFR